MGQKGRLCHRWWRKGHRPPGRCDKRFEWAYIFAAVEPATGADVALVLPEATTTTMRLFLAEFAAAGVTTAALAPYGNSLEEKLAALTTAAEALELAGVA